MNRADGDKPALPAWIHEGIWLDLSGGEEQVSRDLHAVLDTGTRVSAVLIKDWAGSRHAGRRSRPAWDWEFDSRRYASLADDVARYRGADIRTLGYATPYLDAGTASFERARKHGWLVAERGGQPYLFNTAFGQAGFVDLWNPEARAALKQAISGVLLDSGMGGWFADYGFFLPPKNDAVRGLPPIRACREYARLWADLNAEIHAGRSPETVYAMRPLDPRRAAPLLCAYPRSAAWKSTDPCDGLAGELAARIQETGAFYAEAGGSGARASQNPGPAERELSMRWTEAAAFSPVFCNCSAAPVKPWADPAMLSHFARMAATHTMLREYHMNTLESCRAEGTPPVAHPSLYYRGLPGPARSPGQFLYGRDLLVTPALRAGEAFSRCELPEDDWVHLWTSAEFKGGPVSIENPPGFPAAFFRASSRWAGLFDRMRVELKRYA